MIFRKKIKRVFRSGNRHYHVGNIKKEKKKEETEKLTQAKGRKSRDTEGHIEAAVSSWATGQRRRDGDFFQIFCSSNTHKLDALAEAITFEFAFQARNLNNPQIK